MTNYTITGPSALYLYCGGSSAGSKFQVQDHTSDTSRGCICNLCRSRHTGRGNFLPVSLSEATANNFNVANGGSTTGDLTVSGTIDGEWNDKMGAGVMTLSNNTSSPFTGITTVIAGQIRLNPGADIK